MGENVEVEKELYISHPSKLSQNIGFELLVSYSKFPLAISFVYGNIYFQCYSLN